MKDTVAVVLGGGRGTRLHPLTSIRSKPAVPLGGKYRLIDIPLSNCINSGINKVYVLTQFMSASLHAHIRSSYVFDQFSNGFVEILAAQQTADAGEDWFEGTADAVRKTLRYIEREGIEYVIILSGGLRPSPLMRETGRATLDLHITPEQTIADVWRVRLDEIMGANDPIRVIPSRSCPTPRTRSWGTSRPESSPRTVRRSRR